MLNHIKNILRNKLSSLVYMPYKITKNKNGTYKVINKITGKIHSYDTTLENAKKQIRLMQAVDHGYKPKIQFM